VVQRDPNSYIADRDGRFLRAVYHGGCGHRHRTLRGAVRCRDSLRGTTASINAAIVDQDDNPVDPDVLDAVELKEFLR